MHIQHNISQGTISTKIIAYLEAGNQQLSSQRKSSIKVGLCFGFSIVHAYMASQDKSMWWEDILKLVSQWDERSDSLETNINIPEASLETVFAGWKQPITYSSLMYLVTSYVLYNQASEIASEVSCIEQRTFLNKNGLFFSEKAGIQSSQAYVAYFDKGRFRSLLIAIKNSSPLNGMVIVSNERHACSFIYGEKQKLWLFYNPNYHDGQHRFDNEDDLIREIDIRLGRTLVVSVFGFDKMPEKLLSHYQAFYSEEKIAGLSNETALHMFARFAPDKLAEIIALTRSHQNIRGALAKALVFQDQDKYTALHMFARYAPDQLAGIIALAPSHQNIKDALAKALVIQEQNKWTALHMIA